MGEEQKNKKFAILLKDNLLEKAKAVPIFLQNHEWIFTIFFFFTIFIVSIWVWYGSILNVQPSQEVVNDFQLRQQEINNKVQSIERTIEKMQERRMRFNNLPQLANQRDVFDDGEEDGADDRKENIPSLTQ